MIVIYPMLCTSNVQTNVLPGVAKVLEKYVLIYKMDDIIRNVAKETGKKLFKIGSSLRLHESEEILNNENLIEQKTKGTGVDSYVIVSPKEEGRKEKSTIKLEFPNLSTLSLEPTWIKIDTPKGTRLLGIKVIPFPVRSDQELITLVSSDIQRAKLDALLTGLSRSVMKKFWALVRWTHLPFMPLTVSGDPEKDVLWARTFHKENIFLAMNLIDLPSDFFQSAKDIRKLYKLGWSSFVINDDVSKTSYFCMKEFEGLCSATLYQYMFTSLSKELGKVFSDIETLKKTTSPFFKLGTSTSKLFAQKLAQNKSDQFR